MAVPRDTTPEVHSRQLEAYRRMPPEDRLRLAAIMSDEVREIARTGIRARHPDWSEGQIQNELTGLVIGAGPPGTHGRR